MFLYMNFMSMKTKLNVSFLGEGYLLMDMILQTVKEFNLCDIWCISACKSGFWFYYQTKEKSKAESQSKMCNKKLGQGEGT